MPQETPKCLILDIGSNSVIGMFCEWTSEKPSILWEMRFVTGLGKGLVGSNLSNEAQRRTLSAIAEVSAKADASGVYHCLLIGTEALRRASNADDFATALKAQTGATLRVLSPKEELQYERLGFKLSTPAQSLLGKTGLWLIDLGGASCEVTAVDASQTNRYTQSFSLGLIKLQACFEHSLTLSKDAAFAAVQKLINAELASYFDSPLHADASFQAKASIFSGSLPLAFAHQLTGLEDFDANVIEQLDCSREQLDGLCRRAPWPPQTEQKLPLLAALSLREVLAPSVTSLRFSTKGIRHGLLLELGGNML